MNTLTLPPPTSRKLTPLLLILALFLLPVATAGGLYWLQWRPVQTANYGELLQPPLPLPAGTLRGADGVDQGLALRGQWLLLLVGSAPCDAACRQQLQAMRQIQVALNKDMGRLRRLWVGPADAASRAELLRDYPDLTLATPHGNALPATPAPRLYLIDPLGNLILRYPAPAEAQGVRRDLERLLKYSWIG